MSIDLSSYKACLGTLVIDWANRKFTLEGMNGTGTADMTADEVHATFEEHADDPDIEVSALIFWPENEQLCAHDAQGFDDELDNDRKVNGDSEDESDDDDDSNDGE